MNTGRDAVNELAYPATDTHPHAPAPTAEHRWPAVAALVIALALYASLPSSFFPGIRYAVVGIGLLLFIPLIVMNPVRFTRQTEWSRRLSIGQTTLLGVANLAALVALIFTLVTPADGAGPGLLLAALQVWATNVIVFALLYWEIDRGGPVTRSKVARADLPRADFRFAQDEDHDAIYEVAARSSSKSNWRPTYVDYLYMSGSNSMAFSPTDVMPLSHRAKGLMGLQSFAGFVLLALVIARAVSLLG
ncbi:hypothetical protein [Demequina aurantiaca]|uniref:hypothetical protein n=1 Tax=Demequina aurantiaca TaxID=676200 RepID=UPI003D325266